MDDRQHPRSPPTPVRTQRRLPASTLFGHLRLEVKRRLEQRVVPHVLVRDPVKLDGVDLRAGRGCGTDARAGEVALQRRREVVRVRKVKVFGQVKLLERVELAVEKEGISGLVSSGRTGLGETTYRVSSEDRSYPPLETDMRTVSSQW